jgi:hypothetical protein
MEHSDYLCSRGIHLIPIHRPNAAAILPGHSGKCDLSFPSTNAFVLIVFQVTLNYCPVVIGGITVIAVGAWIFPFGLGARYWFKGPVRTISEVEVAQARIKRDDES